MTPSAQRGYDDQKAGRIDAELFCADTNEARDYREGARIARRELAAGIETPALPRVDFAQGTGVLTEQQVGTVLQELAKDLPPPPPPTSCGFRVIGTALEDSTPAPDGNGHLVRVAIPAPTTPGAFADPPAKKARRSSKPKDDGNLNLF